MTKQTIRQIINSKANAEVSDDLLLVQQGITSVNGNLTALGRRVFLDLEFRDGDTKAKIADVVREALAETEEVAQ